MKRTSPQKILLSLAAILISLGLFPLIHAGAEVVTSPPDGGLEFSWATSIANNQMPFAALTLIVFIAGLLTNLTPCVYPMIPITVRLLGAGHRSIFQSSCVYAGGILVTYTSLGLFAALSGSLFGSLMASKSFNFALALIMAFLAVSMLGFGNFSWLQAIGERIGSGKPSLKNTFAMGLGAGFVASPCTGPVLAALLAYTAKSQDVKAGAALLFIYSFGFSLPYVFLGISTSKVKKINLSPLVQQTTKIVFAAMIFALSIYYLRISFYSVFLSFKPANHLLSILGLAIGVISLGLAIFHRKLFASKWLPAFSAFTLSIGIFHSFQLAFSSGPAKLSWHKEEKQAFLEAKEKNLPLLIDAWAEWCEACKKMDRW